MVWQERRSAVRHAIELPIRYRVLSEQAQASGNRFPVRNHKTKNISDTGLLFLSTEYFEVGTLLELSLPVKESILMVEGRVIHADRDSESGLFRTGINFHKSDSVFKVKMAEQVYQIDRYRKLLSKQEGRVVSEEEAARRWIDQHSSDFAEFYKSYH